MKVSINQSRGRGGVVAFQKRRELSASPATENYFFQLVDAVCAS
jgi:hypothetical protein